MRKELKFLILANVSLVFSILYYTFDLLTLCIDDTSKEALLDSEINNTPTVDESSMLIPKIIHQTYKTEDIPEQWIESQKKCIDLHPDYKYILWTDKMAHDFMEKEYPWFLPTFDGYEYPIERADAIRYFILYKYGGVYIDLDDGCERRLDPLLKFPAFVRKTSPTGISNDVMGSVPGHPFFLKLMKSLRHYKKDWGVPYMTIMGSTGPIFVSVIWKQYKRWTNIAAENVVRVLQPNDYKKSSHSFFSIAKGSSWHLDDAHFMKSLENHVLSCVVIGFVFGFWLLYSEYCFYCWLCSNSISTVKKSGINLLKSLTSLYRKYKHGIDDTDLPPQNRTIMFDNNVEFNKKNKQKRSRKDSNGDIMMVDLEKNCPTYTDLSQ